MKDVSILPEIWSLVRGDTISEYCDLAFRLAIRLHIIFSILKSVYYVSIMKCLTCVRRFRLPVYLLREVIHG